MTDFKKLFDEAETAGILNKGQPKNLENFFVEKGILEPQLSTHKSAAYFSELDDNKDDEIQTDSLVSEMPRLVRGFHDVLITIGIIVVLGALAALTNLYVVIIATWLLAEFFVKKQNLALPAFVLTIGFICSASLISIAIFDNGPALRNSDSDSFAAATSTFIVITILLAAFYWRFRIPVSLAVLIASTPAIIFFLILYLTSLIIGEENADNVVVSLGRGLGILFAAILFAIAMKLDASDVLRKTKRSDVAFWLNLLVAPIMLYSLLSLVFFNETGLKINNFGVMQAVFVLIIISAMMMIGVVIDRRAFVTAGLLSLGGAIFVLIKNMDVGYTSFFSISALIVGVIVLTIGVGWEFLRKMIVPNLPQFIVERVPPVKASK